jgi:phosphoribosylanthranilate isomerase
MREPDNLAEVEALHPDYIGLIFYQESPRFVGDDFLLHDARSKDIHYVGVFVNERTQVIVEQAAKVGFDHVQLHGNESTQECAILKKAGLSVIKAFKVGEGFDFSVTAPYADHVDYFLFDTRGLLFGGNARAFDWSQLKAYDQRVPFFLSGGLSPDNVLAALELKDMNLHALDLNSGVEDRPGVKNLNKLKDVFKKLGRQ